MIGRCWCVLSQCLLSSALSQRVVLFFRWQIRVGVSPRSSAAAVRAPGFKSRTGKQAHNLAHNFRSDLASFSCGRIPLRRWERPSYVCRRELSQSDEHTFTHFDHCLRELQLHYRVVTPIARSYLIRVVRLPHCDLSTIGHKSCEATALLSDLKCIRSRHTIDPSSRDTCSCPRRIKKYR